MAFSYWESTEWLEGHDLIVIGGGIVGLSAALQAKKMRPKWKVAVVERDPFGGGGSTKNAGFACFGSLSELVKDTHLYETPGADVFSAIKNGRPFTS